MRVEKSFFLYGSNLILISLTAGRYDFVQCPEGDYIASARQLDYVLAWKIKKLSSWIITLRFFYYLLTSKMF